MATATLSSKPYVSRRSGARIAAGVAACLLVAAMTTGCGEQAPAPAALLRFGEVVPSPASDPADGVCGDVASNRVCWDTARAAPPVVVNRPSDPDLPSDGVLRCGGTGAERLCRLSRERPFRCRDERCEQAIPRLPDDGEWECADVDGVVVCRSHSPAAGVVEGPADPAWICGEGDPRVCVDFSPARPESAADDGPSIYRCHFDHEAGIRRICEPRRGRRLGSTCGEGDCPRGLACVTGICLPAFLPRPDCWTDRDCAEGSACVLATCIGAT